MQSRAYTSLPPHIISEAGLSRAYPHFSLRSELICSFSSFRAHKPSMCSLHDSPANPFLIRAEAWRSCVRDDRLQMPEQNQSLSLCPPSPAFNMQMRRLSQGSSFPVLRSWIISQLPHHPIHVSTVNSISQRSQHSKSTLFTHLHIIFKFSLQTRNFARVIRQQGLFSRHSQSNRQECTHISIYSVGEIMAK